MSSRYGSKATASAPMPSSRAPPIGDYNPADDSYTLHATSQNPHGNRSQLASQCAEDSGDATARDLARRGRRLRHEMRRLSGRRAGAVGIAPARPAGAMGLDAIRSAARRHPRPRSGRARRTGARRRRQGAGAARQLHARGRLARLRLDHGQHLLHHQARARRLRHSGAACGGEGRVHQHRPGASLSRRRPAGGDLSDRAAARPRRGGRSASIRWRSGGATTSRRPRCRTRPRPTPPTTAATSPTSWTSASRSPTGTASRTRAAESKKNGKLRGRGICYFLEEASVFNDRMELRFDPSGNITIVAGTHSHGQGHATVYRADGCRMARRAVRDHPASCRATPMRCRSDAAPTARAACRSAATR